MGRSTVRPPAFLMGNIMRIAGIQLGAGHDVNRNVARAVEMAEVAAEKGAKVIGFPELCFTPWFPRREDKEAFSFARAIEGDEIKAFTAMSLKHQVVLVVPFFEKSADRFYNSAAIIDCGKVLGAYRKLHIPDIPFYKEQFYFSPGDNRFPVFETSRGTIGVQICWDNLFPEGTRILALKGADVVFAPTAASVESHTLWERAVSSNAFANNLFAFRVNRVGQEDGIAFYGRSFCAGPWGETVSELAGSKDAIVSADIDRKDRDAAIETWGFLRQRRPSEYGEIVKDEGKRKN
jgi:predicted amidohydrolase